MKVKNRIIQLKKKYYKVIKGSCKDGQCAFAATLHGSPICNLYKVYKYVCPQLIPEDYVFEEIKL